MDLPTIALAVGLQYSMQAVGFFVLWRMNRTLRGIGWWLATALLFAIGMPAFGIWSGTAHPLFGLVLPTLAVSTGMACFYIGAAAFGGAMTLPRWPFGMAGGILAAYIVFSLVLPQVPVRPLLTGGVFLLFLLLGVRELLRENRPGLRLSARFTAAVTLGYCAILLFRALVLPWWGGGMVVPLFAGVAPQILTFLGALVWSVLWTFGTVLLINQRQLHELRSITTERVREQEKRAETERRLAIAERELAEKRLIEERQKILRDLHDGVGGVTANLALLAGLGTAARSENERGDLFRRIEQLATQGNRELRLLLDLFEQGDVHWADVLHEMRSYAATVTQANRIELQWTTRGSPPASRVHDPMGAISLTRAFKEAVNNAVRHAKAEHLDIRIRFLGQSLALSVRDDGHGLPATPADPQGGGRGLGQMRRRMEELHGRFSLRHDKGTRIRLAMPLGPIQARTFFKTADSLKDPNTPPCPQSATP